MLYLTSSPHFEDRGLVASNGGQLSAVSQEIIVRSTQIPAGVIAMLLTDKVIGGYHHHVFIDEGTPMHACGGVTPVPLR